MLLINTRTLAFQNFQGIPPEPYAILSHTWGPDEVTHEEYLAHPLELPGSLGFSKIAGSCRQARRENPPLDWIWIDTCCIDKRSSAELSEAINSMYAWYNKAEVCYAYLSDVAPFAPGGTNLLLDNFARSRWFTRGWTLQELVAPREVVFFANDWTVIGSKRTSPDLMNMVAQVTSIDIQCLNGTKHLSEISIAGKMSWLSRRQTTRTEDLAYCALGIFDINMPLLYGEGAKAFTRLQEHILQDSTDHSIFCWSWNETVPDDWASMLAPSPTCFADCGDYKPRPRKNALSPHSITSAGLSIRLDLLYSRSQAYAILDANRSGGRGSRACVPLVYSENDGDVMKRCPLPPGPLVLTGNMRDRGQPTNLFVRRRPERMTRPPAPGLPSFKYGLVVFIDESVLPSINRSFHYRSAQVAAPWNQKKMERASRFSYWNYSLVALEPQGECHAGIIRIPLPGMSAANFVVFFAVRQLETGQLDWYCDMNKGAATPEKSGDDDLLSLFWKKYHKSRYGSKRRAGEKSSDIWISIDNVVRTPISTGSVIRAALLSAQSKTVPEPSDKEEGAASRSYKSSLAG